MLIEYEIGQALKMARISQTEKEGLMTHFLNIEQLEQEILYLQEQNRKLIKELSEVVEENHRLRKEIIHEKRPSQDHGEDKKRETRSATKGYGSKNIADEGLCLN